MPATEAAELIEFEGGQAIRIPSDFHFGYGDVLMTADRESGRLTFVAQSRSRQTLDEVFALLDEARHDGEVLELDRDQTSMAELGAFDGE